MSDKNYGQGKADAQAEKPSSPPYTSFPEALADAFIPPRGSFEKANKDYKRGYEDGKKKP